MNDGRPSSNATRRRQCAASVRDDTFVSSHSRVRSFVSHVSFRLVSQSHSHSRSIHSDDETLFPPRFSREKREGTKERTDDASIATERAEDVFDDVG